MISTLAGWTGALLLSLSAPAHLNAQTAAAIPSEAEAPIAMLVDLSSGQILHARNIDRRFMPASITKVMTAYVAFGLLENGDLQPNERFFFSPEAFAEWGATGSTMFINRDESPTVPQLLLGITTVSANDASAILAEGAAGSKEQWLGMMNASARSLGMANSHFGTPNGWPDEGRTFTTARDLVMLGQALIQHHPKRYKRYFGHRELSYNGITQPNHEPLTGRVLGGDGIKTGFTNEAGYGVLGSAERDGRRLVLVVAGADSSRIRGRAARAYMEWGFANFDSRNLFEAGATVGSARVQGGNARSVSLVTPRLIAAAVPKGAESKVALAIKYNGPIRAPIIAGDQIAELVIAVEGMEPSHVPLYAAESVSEAGPLARVLNGIIGWFT